MKTTHDEHAAAMNTIAALMEILGTSDSLSISGQVAALKAEREALAAENRYLLNGAARELTTSWMFHKTMLGAQAALVCLSHGYQAAAREWLEGTTDEAGAEIPDDISVGELPEWFESKMVSNDGNSGFLTRQQAEAAIKAEIPATDRFSRELKAKGVDALCAAAEQLMDEFNDDSYKVMVAADLKRFASAFAQQLRERADK